MPRKQAFPKSPSNQVFGHPLRVGLYARVSTHDQQALPLQIRAMREYAFKRGWTIVAQIKEVGSGASQRELRTTLIAAARRREVDVVLVWRLDRWGRSVADLVSTLQELQHQHRPNLRPPPPGPKEILIQATLRCPAGRTRWTNLQTGGSCRLEAA